MKSAEDARWAIRDTLRSRGFQVDPVSPSTYRGKIDVGHQKLDISIHVPDVRFCSLPEVRLIDPAQADWEILAHQQTETGICYGLEGYYNLDPLHPGEAILRVLSDVAQTLLRSSKGRGATEVAQEYPAYWGGPERPLLSTLQHGEVLDLVRRQPDHAGPALMFTPGRQKAPVGYTKTGKRIRVIELKETVEPVRGIVKPSSLKALVEWTTENASASVANEIYAAIGREDGVILSAPNGIFGAWIETPKVLRQVRGTRPGFIRTQASRRGQEFVVERFRGASATLDSIIRRSLPESSDVLIGKSVCLVGCGAIGSHLSRLLVQLGAGCGRPLLIVDPDILKPGNIGRHALGFSYVEDHKAQAMSVELRRFHPDLQVEFITLPVSDAYDRAFKSDLIIDATGVENVSTDLNREALERWANGKTFALFHAFLFGYGVAAQSFANLGADNAACFRCLRPDREKPWKYDPRRSPDVIEEPVQDGCGSGAFLPYGPYAGMAAASLSAQHIHDWVSGRSAETLRTVVLDTEKGRQQAPRSPTAHEGCLACS